MIEVLIGKILRTFLAPFLTASLLGVCCNQRALLDESGVIIAVTCFHAFCTNILIKRLHIEDDSLLDTAQCSVVDVDQLSSSIIRAIALMAKAVRVSKYVSLLLRDCKAPFSTLAAARVTDYITYIF
jgi:hypothetical protein